MLCKKNEKNCINATRRAPNRARHFFCLYAALVCGVCFALPAFLCKATTPASAVRDFSRLRAGWSLRLQKKSWT